MVVTMKKNILYILLSMFILYFYNCSNTTSSLDNIPFEILLTAPERLVIEDKEIKLKSFLWRDFTPGIHGGGPLTALLFIETSDSSKIPISINPEAIYVINKTSVWNSLFSEEEPAPDQVKPYRIIKIARNGPKWEPEIFVDVIVKIVFNKKIHLLKASHQLIESPS
jgi:hypothetical protein